MRGDIGVTHNEIGGLMIDGKEEDTIYYRDTGGKIKVGTVGDNGTTTFREITKEMCEATGGELVVDPFKLAVGYHDQYSRYGLENIIQRLDELKKVGFGDAVSFVYYVLQNANAVRRGKVRDSGTPTYFIRLKRAYLVHRTRYRC